MDVFTIKRLLHFRSRAGVKYRNDATDNIRKKSRASIRTGWSAYMRKTKPRAVSYRMPPPLFVFTDVLPRSCAHMPHPPVGVLCELVTLGSFRGS